MRQQRSDAIDPVVEHQLLKGARIRTGRLGRAPKMMYPSAIEAFYRASLLDYVKRLRAIVSSVTERYMPAIGGAVEGERKLRVDSWADDVERMVGDLRRQFDALQPALGPLIERTANKTDNFELQQWRKTMRSVIGVELYQREPWLKAEIDSFTKSNVQLVKQLTDDLSTQINTVVSTGFRAGKRWETIRGELLATKLEGLPQVPALKKVENRARLIARDQVSKLNGNLSRLRQQSLNIDTYIWRTSMDERVRPSHNIMEGRLCRWDDPTVMSNDNGKTWVARPSTAVKQHPGEDYQCRCYGEPNFGELLDELKPKVPEGEPDIPPTLPPVPPRAPVPAPVAGVTGVVKVAEPYWKTFQRKQRAARTDARLLLTGKKQPTIALDLADTDNWVKEKARVKAYEDALKVMYPRSAFDFTGIKDSRTAYETSSQYYALQKKFKPISRIMKYFGTYADSKKYRGITSSATFDKNTFAHAGIFANKKYIGINSRWFGSREEYLSAIKKSSTRDMVQHYDPAKQKYIATQEVVAFHPADIRAEEYIQSVVTHEYGHQVHRLLEDESRLAGVRGIKSPMLDKYTTWKTKHNFSLGERTAAAVSQYACKNDMEFFAECFATIFHAPKNTWVPAVKELADIVEKGLTL